MADVRDIQQSMFLDTSGTQLIENDSSGREIYIGKASPGSATNKNRWQIRRITYDANNAATAIEFAGGSNEFDKKWDDRATYTYS